jgi:hypothetical protein
VPARLIQSHKSLEPQIVGQARQEASIVGQEIVGQARQEASIVGQANAADKARPSAN